jgi:hypothetical protein
VPVAAAGGDEVRVGDLHVVKVEADDGVVVAVEFAAERSRLDFGLPQRAIAEQELGHRR